MKAMLLAAGLGTRLRPLTNDTPKCLMVAGGKTLLEHNLNFLKKAGVREVIVNVHYLADQVIHFLSQQDFGVTVQVSYEEELLETGGGLKKVQSYFEKEPAFVVSNSDIYTDLDLTDMIRYHIDNGNFATLATAQRKTSRYLLFDDHQHLSGWENLNTNERIVWGKKSNEQRAFNGCQILSSKFFQYMDDLGEKFSTIPVYLRAAQAGEKIMGYAMDHHYWVDIGTHDKLNELKQYLTSASGHEG